MGQQDTESFRCDSVFTPVTGVPRVAGAPLVQHRVLRYFVWRARFLSRGARMLIPDDEPAAAQMRAERPGLRGSVVARWLARVGAVQEQPGLRCRSA